jgi:transposase
MAPSADEFDDNISCATETQNCSGNGELFRLYVEKVLMPTLLPTDIVVMDHLGSHKGKAARRAIRAIGPICSYF